VSIFFRSMAGPPASRPVLSPGQWAVFFTIIASALLWLSFPPAATPAFATLRSGRVSNAVSQVNVLPTPASSVRLSHRAPTSSSSSSTPWSSPASFIPGFLSVVGAPFLVLSGVIAAIGLVATYFIRAPTSPVTIAALGVSSAVDSDPTETHRIPPFLNKTPHTREVRDYFYADALQSLSQALAAGETRMELKTIFPELNTESDVFRVGTMLEMVRYIATDLAGQGKHVKICVQQSLGEGIFSGLPLGLAGMMKLAKLMDWDEATVGDRISFGEVGANHVQDTDDIFLLIAPQNITGCSIIQLLEEMCAVAGARPIVIINPKLGDIMSSSGVMSYRGREERIQFVSTFKPIHHFRLLYKKPFFYPIYGALRMSYGGPWVVYRREGDPDSGVEEYVLAEKFPSEPDPEQITRVVLQQPKRGLWGFW